MQTRLALLGIALVLISSTVAAAQKEGGSVEWKIALGSALYDNFFEAPEGLPKEEVSAATLELEVLRRMAGSGEWAIFAGVMRTEYEEGLGDSHRGTAGVRLDGSRAGFSLEAVVEDSKPSVSVRDEFDRKDSARLRVRYSYRVHRHWELGVGGYVGEESFDLSPQKDSDLNQVGVSVRYRGFGSKFSPEVGFDSARRRVVEATEDYDQEDLYLQLRSAPNRRLYLSVRLRERSRDYLSVSPTARNFARRDDRTQLALTATYDLSRRFRLNLYATDQDAESTRESRIFDSRLISFWLSAHLGR